MAKRPGLRQWGQTLKAPASGGYGWQEIFSDVSHFNVQTSGTTCTVTTGPGSALFKTTSLVEGTDFANMLRLRQPSDGTVAAGETGKMDFRFMFRALSPMPARSSATAWRGFGGGFENDSGVSVGFEIFDLGIYIHNGGTFTLVPGTDIDDGSWHVVEMQQTSTTNVNIYIDDGDAIATTYSDSSVFDPQSNSGGIGVTNNANGLIECEVAFIQGRSGNGNIAGVPITAIYPWTSVNPTTRHFLVVAGDTIYDDPDHGGVFKPIFVTPSGALTIFTPFGSNLLIVNPRAATHLWGGSANIAPEPVPSSFPARAYVATQHQGRCVIVTEDDPLLVLVGGANTLEDWTTPDFESPTGQSFTIPIPDATGEKVTNLTGDFYGQLIMETDNSVYALAGDGVETYVLRNVSSKVGCSGPRAADRVGGDLLTLSQHGGHSLKTTQEYGDLSSAYVTVGLRNLWQRDSFFNLPKVLKNYRASVVHAPHLARTYFAVQTQEGDIPNRLYEYNHDISQWSGPWTVECEAIAFFLLGTPPTPLLVLGDSDGHVTTADDDRKFDLGSNAYTYRLRSARLDGRSLEPSLSRRTKLWRALRLYVLPRGPWHLDVSWTADGHDREGDDLPNQNRYKEAVLNSTFFLNQSEIVDAEKIGVIDIPLDFRGKWFEFTIEQAEANEDAVVVRAEVDIIVGQEDKENA